MKEVDLAIPGIENNEPLVARGLKLIEESVELASAIYNNDMDNIQEEIMDVLQVVLGILGELPITEDPDGMEIRHVIKLQNRGWNLLPFDYVIRTQEVHENNG